MKFSLIKDYIPRPYLKNKVIIKAIPEKIKSVADIGCGKGELINWLRRNTKYKVYGIDIDPMDSTILKGDLTDIENFPITRVDVSICSQVLEHIKHWRLALENLIKVTKKKVIITIPWKESYFAKDHINFWDDDNIGEFVDICSSYQVKIEKNITKPEDVEAGRRIYFIEIDVKK